MRPEKIFVQAFGPYIQPCELDFERLDGAQLFLITGPTGSGKTSLLDAMSAALYGRASGSLRSDWKSMRSTAAPDEDDTIVEFTFSLGSERYRFMRTYTSRMVKRRSGGREFVLEAEAECSRCFDGEWELLCTGTAVSAKARELLGFTYEQFSQVIVLPQGEFRKLLTASSSEKEGILEVLFSTGRWRQIAELASSHASALHEELTQIRTEQGLLLKRENAESKQAVQALWEEFAVRMEALLQEAKAAEAEVRAANDAFAKADALHGLFKRHAALKDEILLLAQKQPSMDVKRRQMDECKRIEAVYPYLTRVVSAREEAVKKSVQLEQSVRKADKARLEWDDARKQADSLPTLKGQQQEEIVQLDRLSRALDERERLEKLQIEIEGLKKQLDEKQAGKEGLQKKTGEIAGRIANGEEYITKQSAYIASIPQLTEKMDRLDRAFREYERLQNGEKKLLAATEGERAARLELAKKTEHSSAVQKSLQLLEARIQADKAYALAATLTDGEPCPVCGSTSHPVPAPLPDGLPSAGEMEAVRRAAEKADEAVRLLTEEVSRWEASVKVYQDTVLEGKAVFLQFEVPQEGLAEARDEAAAALSAAQKAAREHPKLNAGLEKLRIEQAALQKEMEQMRAEITNIEKQMAGAAERGEELQKNSGGIGNSFEIRTQLTTLRVEVEQRGLRIQSTEQRLTAAGMAMTAADSAVDAARRALAEAETEKSSSQRRFEEECFSNALAADADLGAKRIQKEHLTALEQEIIEYDRAVHTSKSQQAHFEKELSGKEVPDLEKFNAFREELTRKKTQTDSELGEVKVRMQTLSQSLERLNELFEKSARLEGNYTKTAAIASLLKGNNPLNTPIHQFVLGIMLDEIVQMANKYFERLSHGQYSLIRMDTQGGRGYRGLELYVSDAHRGGTRSVNTLSGGELFLASLSLAFGLADTVQSYAGGIRLDSVFIDEGFGTLDSETLEHAMCALSDIQASGRLVGIISHVNELKERIVTRIEIFPHEKKGSAIRIVH